MIEGLAAVRARVAQLEQLTAPARAGDQVLVMGGTLAPQSSSGDFASVLAGVGSSLRSSASGSLSAAGAPGGDLAEKVIGIARKYVGVPYRWGGTNPKTGLDCSGFTQLVFRQVGVSLPRVSRDQARVGREVGSLAQALPGDLVFFNSPVSHVGIYLGDGKMLDAPRPGGTVGVHEVWETPSHIRRVLPQTRSAASVSAAGADVSGPYAAQFSAAGRRYGVDPALLSAVAKAESSYNAGARSPAGALGLMQLMPATARQLGVDALDPDEAIDGAARLLSGYLRTYSGRVDLALAAYNAGPGAVKKYGGVPPYAETRAYIKRVTTYWEALR